MNAPRSPRDVRVLGRAKKRKAPGGPTSPEPNYTRVFVWELEELYPMHNDYCYQSVTQILISGFAVDHSDVGSLVNPSSDDNLR